MKLLHGYFYMIHVKIFNKHRNSLIHEKFRCFFQNKAIVLSLQSSSRKELIKPKCLIKTQLRKLSEKLEKKSNILLNKNLTFEKAINVLKSKRKEELIYHIGSQKLYCTACFCFAITFLVYGALLLEYGTYKSNKEYNENTDQLEDVLRKRVWAKTFGFYSFLGSTMFGFAVFFIWLPFRQIYKIWYVPGPIEKIKFQIYSPFLKYRKEHVTCLKNIRTNPNTNVWTGKGPYGVSDNALFFFNLVEKLENGATKNWKVNRRGFFWYDGRIFDYLFGKKSLLDSKLGILYVLKMKMIKNGSK